MNHPPYRLKALEPQLVRLGADQEQIEHVESVDEAQGVMFLCPLCYYKNDGPVGTHSVLCWSSSAGVPDSIEPSPGRWRLSGTGYADLTLNGEQGKSRSVLLTAGCAWHGFVTGGLVTSA